MKRQLELILVENLLLCLCLGIEVLQKEKFLTAPVGQNVTMTCTHNDQSYITMLWYQQKKEGGMKLILYSTGKDNYDIEDKENQNKWLLERPDILISNLTIKNTEVQDSAVYFCASSTPGQGNTIAYFGGGTVLSILEEGQEPKKPNVSIYRPNKQELKDHNFISLVCVASDFFPEHVKIQWFVNSVKRINVYEPTPQKKGNNSYSTSKRLTLTREEYFNPDSTFRCVAAFLDGSLEASEEIKGETDCGVSKEFYTMYINQGKISYIMILCKSGLYALVVLVLVWRKKVIAHSY